MGLYRFIKIAECGTRFDIGTPFLCINSYSFHIRKIDHHAVIAQSTPGDVVPTTSDDACDGVVRCRSKSTSLLSRRLGMAIATVEVAGNARFRY